MEAFMPAKPTPTQAENDRAALGEHILEHEDDGSGPDPFAEANEQARLRAAGKHVEAGKPAQAYQTRQAQPAKKEG
jgi:hypothetical protein